jgi:hypothetical protein
MKRLGILVLLAFFSLPVSSQTQHDRINARGTGPNPYIDVTMFGARATPFNLMPQTSCTTKSGSTTMTLPGGASKFVNGDGIVCRGAGATTTIGTPAAPTVTPASAIGPTGTGQMAANAVGALTNQYCVVAADIGGGLSPCSPVTSVSTANTLGAQNVAVTSWTAASAGPGSIVKVTTSARHTMVAGTYISIINDPNINGFWKVVTVPDNTHFTFQTSNQTILGFPASGGALATVFWWQANRITWPEVPNAIRYYVYGRTAGSMALIGVTTIQSSTLCACFTNNPGPPSLIANQFDDYGPSLTQNLSNNNVPEYVPATPPRAAKNKDLVTTIVSGAGTTTLTVANAASNSVVAQTMKIDNTPNIQAAINAASLNGSTTQGVLFFPAPGIPGLQYETNSMLQLFSGSIGTLSVQQAGAINLGDMMYTSTRVHWTGAPLNPHGGAPSFTRGSIPVISSSRAWPMFYASNKQINFKHVQFAQQQPNQGYAWITDQGGAIPGSTWEDMEFVSSGNNDTMNILFLFRGDSNGGADFTFNRTAYLTGPGSQAPGVTTTPAFYGDGMPSPMLFTDTFLSLRTIYFRLLPQGLTAAFELIYDEGGIEPMIGLGSFGGAFSTNLEIRGAVADTMGAPIFSYFGTPQGVAKVVPFSGVGSGQPFSNGPGGLAVSGAGPTFAFGTSAAGGPAVTNAMDGVINRSMSAYPLQSTNAAFAVPNALQYFVQGATTAPTCTVSAGGTAPIQSYVIRVAPVFPNGGALAEGAYGANSNTCTTTSGNQTVTTTWPAVPGAVGYDVAENNRVVGCNPGFISGGNNTTYVRNNKFPVTCGFTINSPGGGVTSVARGGLSAQALRLNNNFSSAFSAAPLTANRSVTAPDATGTMALLPTAITPANNDCVKWTLASGVYTLNTNGGPCSARGGGVTVFALSTASYSVSPEFTYFGVSSSTAAASVSQVQVPVAAAGTVSNLRFNLSTNIAASSSVTYTLNLNGTDTALTCTIAASTSTCSDLTHSFAIVPGDLLALKISFTGSPGTPQQPYSVKIQ